MKNATAPKKYLYFDLATKLRVSSPAKSSVARPDETAMVGRRVANAPRLCKMRMDSDGPEYTPIR